MRRYITILMMILLSTIVAQGQIKIGGNVYGGGNHAEVKGSTKVTVSAGDIGAVLDTAATRPLEDPQGKVFGGARMANVGGNAFVHIDGEHASGYILINQVYGGNDIAGQIGTGTVPSELTAVKSNMPSTLPEGKTAEDYNDVDDFNSFVRISTKATSTHYTAEEIAAASNNPEAAAYGKKTTDVKPDPNAKKVYIGQLFAGGNGDFEYPQEKEDGEYVIKQGNIVIARSTTPFVRPEVNKAYLEVLGGSIVYAYGGGNNVTVKTQNIIHIDNPSAVVNHILVNSAGVEGDAETYTAFKTNGSVDGYSDLLSTARFKEMGINTTFSHPSSGEYQVGRFFGGNNKAEMNIRPTWNLLAGKVRNLYSGGNKGNMTSPDGLLLEIPAKSSLIVDNLFGGCRMADVKPTVNGDYVPCANLPGYNFPSELSARTLVCGGHIHNVYGGNDVTGTVYGGNAVGIYTAVYGDVYGGGNGAYPYTDSPYMEDDDTYGDFFFEQGDHATALDALNAFRPNAEQVSLRLAGTDAEHKTVIKGSVFVGGNCASLATKKDPPLVELKIGSHVIADKVFLGNNGEKMVDSLLLQSYKDNSGIVLTDSSSFEKYMNGVAMPLKPDVVFDDETKGDPATYISNSSMIGSFYGGGNKGSMIISGKTTLSFNRSLIIFDKLVGGCNDADVEETELNASYEGGLLGSADEWESYTDGVKIKDRLELNLDSVVIRPQRWTDTFNRITSGTLTAGNVYYETDLHDTKFIADGEEPAATAENPYYELATVGLDLEWNTAKWDIGEGDFISTGIEKTGSGKDCEDVDRRLLGGNVYGGCYNSGHVNGNVVININQDLIDRNVVFAEPDSENPYQIKDESVRRTGVLRESQGDDVMAVAMTVFGAGCGEDTEIWGSTTVNHNNGYAFQIFGGGEEGVVGKKNDKGKYAYNAAYSTTVNLKGNYPCYSENESGQPLAEAEYIYGGGNEGDVLGDSYVYLGNGRVYDAFGGACNADIYGGAELYIGYNGGFPWIRNNVYGGNDFGGIIRGDRNHYTVTTRPVFEEELKRSSTYVKYIQGRVDSIFGGNYGYYNYADRIFKDYTDAEGTPLKDEGGNPIFSFPHLNNNSFVHFVPEDNSKNQLNYIFGGSAGYPGNVALNDAMQKETYVLIDDTKTKDVNRFANVDIYGGGAFAGVGTPSTLGAGDTTVDLFAGCFHNVYGGCNQEGLVGYTRVNVPSGSTVKVNALFGGGKGYSPAMIEETPALAASYCDHYVTCIDYKSKDAIVNDAIYGGNENSRISCDTYINIEAPVMQSSGYQATIYGAGYGKKTVSGRTNVFMNNTSNAYKVFGGGRDGNAFNFVSLQRWLANQFLTAGTAPADVEGKVTAYGNILRSFGTYLASNPISLPTNIGTYLNSEGKYDGTYTNDIVPTEEIPMPTYHQTNVHIMNGGNVSGYAYGGGYGTDAVVAGSTYIELKGGNVDKDIYGGGQGGPVFDEFGLGTNVFTATTNVYIEGGMARNVYGGGYQGHVGKHSKTVNNVIVEAGIHETDVVDIPAVANVTIGKVDGTSFYQGIPAITRNVYGGGEGGSVYGTANLTINNGYIGYRYKNTATSGSAVYEYVEELDDQKPGDLDLSGNVFGGGYVVNSYVDNTNIDMYGGIVRGSLYGGGEVGPIGRGTVRYKGTYDTGLVNGDARIFKAGTTQVNMYDGQVLRNVFGGGRGKDSWGGDGTMYMEPEVVAKLDLKCKGYVFGQTRVNIYGGEIGTAEGMTKGYGNVFGGGDEGTLYSAYMDGNNLRIGKKIGDRYDGRHEGYYFEFDGTNFLTKTDGETNIFTEDCKVVVEPHAQAKENLSITGGTGSPRGDGSYEAGEYVTTADLNRLKSKNDDDDSSTWDSLDDFGIIIHNAVFAGGNIAAGSSTQYANATTVFGNATASIHDVYNRDLITIGTGHTGGFYGDGNLTFVDGYRELNITNYGTDYYHITKQLKYEDYKKLPEREKAYYELKYKCLKNCTDYEGTTYYAGTADSEGSNLPMDELLALFTKPDGTSVLSGSDSIIVTVAGKKVPNSTYWQENGVVSIYAGRIMNTIQRADFCGVFGSRMVMKGAQDRVPEIADYTNYTINRVREVSLNKKVSVNKNDIATYTAADETADPNHKAGTYKDPEAAEHGNYFGIYSNVNYLGALTSDVLFSSARTTNADTLIYENLTPKGETFYEWKEAHKDDKTRNNGTCHNHLALASGVYLELTTEKSKGNTLDKKDWGPITGVIELDLINVQTGIGGGFVYARNEHGKPGTGRSNTTLTALNDGAASKWNYTYDGKYNNWEESDADGHKEEWQTSGNFIHSSQTIIDDCYNVGSKYHGKYGNKDHGGDSNGVPAHYWYIAGSVYVYDQYISAYTGLPNAFSETVEVPITINAASHGTMTLMDVQPNLYAYYSTYTDATNNTPLSGEQKLVINDVTYQLNDPISYWDWNKLPAAEKKLFVADTYVLKDSCYINSKYYPAGYVMLPSECDSLKTYAVDYEIDDKSVKAVKKATKNAEGEDVVEKDSKGQDMYVAFDDAFRSSNNLSHTTGYLLTYNVTNPSVWDKWYTKVQDDVVNNENVLVKNQTGGSGYEDGPTYHPTTTGLYGQQPYDLNAIISKNEYDKYNGYDSNSDGDYSDAGDVYGLKQMYSAVSSRTDQAAFTSAYLITQEYDSGNVHYYPGAPVSAPIAGYTAPAYVCTATVQLTPTEFIYVNDLMTEAQKNKFKTDYSALATEIEACVKPAYICTTAGLYGGSYYETGKNYRALEAYSALSPEDRLKFAFNYDALDLLIDPNYSKNDNGDIIHPTGKKYQYDSAAGTLTGANNNPAHYSLATPIDYTATYKGESPMTYSDAGNNSHTIAVNQELTSTVYETLPNEQHHYAPITVDKAGDYYVVKESFVHGETPYAVGTTIDSGTYDRLTQSEKANYITILSFAADDVKLDGSSKPIPYYYCRESYTVNENGEGATVSKYKNTIGTGNASYTTGGKVPVGYIITATNYNSLPNRQKNFTIHGVSPMETSTLYVARNADINDLSKEKIITVVYKYDYEESDKDGTHITPVSERHVVNIHINFKSGVPVVDDINPPTIVLPGTSIIMRPPNVTPGAYEITGGGWELFDNKLSAESHTNGVAYRPSVDSLYWYQDGFYLAYYAKTYLGKTYSNYVPVSVANYHDLKKVMDDKQYHLHVDYDRTRLKRDSKIYINDYSSSSQNGLDLFKDFYDLSLITKETTGITTAGDSITTSGHKFKGHKLLNTSTEEGTNIYDDQTYQRGVKGGKNLEFFLHTDIDYPDNPATDDWTSIGTDEQCFEGTLHGDGHTISGLDHSLFNNLCGNVYNLGVMGSFNSAGVVDKGIGYVESAWVKTTAKTPASSKPNAVFGNPTDTDTEGYQLVNSYFYEGNKDLYANVSTNATTGVTTSGGDRGKATAKSDTAFYNGELAYDLNNFYLYKRYNDHKSTSGTEKQMYSYLTIGNDGKLSLQNNHYYTSNPSLCSTGFKDDQENVIMYVEERFADGDFRYVGDNEGIIPDSEDERFQTWTVTDDTGKETLKSGFFPIWPDDYIFFGQKLTYSWGSQAHQNVPTAVARFEGRLSQNDDANRVYRAPAYYRSKEMGVAHFNPHAYLAQTQKNVPTTMAYPDMTAIDFKGHNDLDYQLGMNDGWFYTPLLDDDGLLSIVNADETKNLLVYAPASGVNAKTYSVLNNYFQEPEFVALLDSVNTANKYTDGKIYNRVADATAESVYGHLVQSDLKATNDHLLVDKQDFNAPIGYSFDNDHRMWYQRKPDNYVDLTQGWEGISLPFTVQLVTTQDKGELTHFYKGNTSGHEYWLREYKGKSKDQPADASVYKADFDPLAAGTDTLYYTNTFLWDYYYSRDYYWDKNQDEYQKKYYSSEYLSKLYPVDNYPYSQGGTPYIIGFPSLKYYEFDLSGSWIPQNRINDDIGRLPKQTVTFASFKGADIGVSDDEMDGVSAESAYTFKPSYMNYSGNLELAADQFVYLLDDEGASFKKTAAAAVTVTAFRPYFIDGPSTSRSVEQIVFGQSEDPQVVVEEEHGDPTQEELNGGLRIWAKKDKIYVESSLSFTEDMRVVTPAGITVATFSVKPGKTVEVQADFSGMYIVHTLDGKYTKKVTVKK